MIVVKHVVVAEIPLLEMVESDIDHRKSSQLSCFIMVGEAVRKVRW